MSGPLSKHKNKSPIKSAVSAQEEYGDEFQSPSNYVEKVESEFTIKYQSASYQDIEKSTTQMRSMMKEWSATLDDKLHKYYGLMGLKHQTPELTAQKVTEQYQKEIDANRKLIENQESELKHIEELDKEFSSNKKLEKQADRLRDYFDTKKSMVDSQRQSKFEKGEVNKNGDYLARDLDSDKFYFRLNKNKEDFQYAMLKTKKLQKQNEALDQKMLEIQQKLREMTEKCDQAIEQAVQQKLLIVQNKKYYQTYHRIQQLKKQKEEKSKISEVLTHNIKNTSHNIFVEVQALQRKVDLIQEKFDSTSTKVQAMKTEISDLISKNQIVQGKMDQSMSIKNIEVLLKAKKSVDAGNGNKTKNNGQNADEDMIKPITMSESTVLKPNFKIKPLLMSPRVKSNSQKFKDSKEHLLNISSGGKTKAKNPILFRSSQRKSLSLAKQKPNKTSVENAEQSQQRSLKEILESNSVGVRASSKRQNKNDTPLQKLDQSPSNERIKHEKQIQEVEQFFS